MRASVIIMSLAFASPAVADDCFVSDGKYAGYRSAEAIVTGPPPILLIDDEKLNDWIDVVLELAADESGRVTCMKFKSGEGRLTQQALALAKQWRFQPYLVSGKAFAVYFDQRINVRWRNPRPTQRVPFPAVSDWATLRIKSEMSPGYMGCLGTEIEIAGDGTIIFASEYRRAGSLDQWGHSRETGRLPPGGVQALVERFRQAEFFWLHDSYTGDLQDMPYGWISIAFDGHKKRIRDEGGGSAGMPAEVTALRQEIDRLADLDRRVARTDCH